MPVLLPSAEQVTAIAEPDSRGIVLGKVQEIYDRAYEHDGLMGTDLDKTYDRVTKQILLGFAEPLASKRVLDLGTGTGSLWDYATTGVEGYALDLSAVGVCMAVERHPNLTACVSIAEFLPFATSFFDLVIAADTIEHTFSPRRALAEIRRVLKPGGVLGASFPIPDSLRKWGWNQLVCERPDFRLLFGLARVLVRRTVLFGKPDFQPIDRDYSVDKWAQMLQAYQFRADQVVMWPEPPKLPIVTLMKAVRG